MFNLTYPRRDLLETFEKRVPYRYIQYAHFQVRLGGTGAVPKAGVQNKCRPLPLNAGVTPNIPKVDVI